MLHPLRVVQPNGRTAHPILVRIGLACFCASVLAPLARVQACSCVRPPGPLPSLEASDAVFSGRVVAVEIVSTGNRLDMKKVTFEVLDCWKGPVTDRVVVYTALYDAACGFWFTEGAEYLVYARSTPGKGLETGLCSRTQALGTAGADLEALGEPHCLTAVERSDWGTLKRRFKE